MDIEYCSINVTNICTSIQMIIGSCRISQNFSLVKYYFCIEKRIESHVPGYFCEKSDIICAKVPMEGPRCHPVDCKAHIPLAMGFALGTKRK